MPPIKIDTSSVDLPTALAIAETAADRTEPEAACYDPAFAAKVGRVLSMGAVAMPPWVLAMPCGPAFLAGVCVALHMAETGDLDRVTP